MADYLLEYKGYLTLLQVMEEVLLWEQLWYDLEEARLHFE